MRPHQGVTPLLRLLQNLHSLAAVTGLRGKPELSVH